MKRCHTTLSHVLANARRLTVAGIAAVTAGCTIQTEPPEFAEPAARVAPAARLEIEGFAVIPAPSVPVEREIDLRVPYRGSEAYLVGETWFYRSPERGWVVFREEPRELARYRIDDARRRAARIEGHEAERLRRPPERLDRAERVRWRGHEAYLIDGKWYVYVPDEGWVVLREEPRELGRRRYELRRDRGELGYPRR